jgi:hypothetical protein
MSSGKAEVQGRGRAVRHTFSRILPIGVVAQRSKFSRGARGGGAAAPLAESVSLAACPATRPVQTRSVAGADPRAKDVAFEP